MTFDRTRGYLQLFRGLDLIMIVVAFLTSILLVQSRFASIKFAHLRSLQVASREIIMLSVFLVIWAAVLSASSLYRSRRLSTMRSEIFEVLQVTGAAAIFTFIGGLAAASKVIAPVQVTVFFAVAFCLILSYRVLAREIARRLRIHGRNLRHVLIIGTGPRALDFVAWCVTGLPWGIASTALSMMSGPRSRKRVSSDTK